MRGQLVAEFQAALIRACQNAPFLKQLADSQPELTALLETEQLDAALAWGKNAGADAADVRQQLRREKKALALTLAVGDLAGALDLTAVTQHLSDFADQALNIALTDIYAARGRDRVAGFAVIALGKHGSRELNYSSDIDPIFLYDPAQIPCRPREEPADAARRIGQALVEALSARDGDGYVFRVDMRLRPSPEVSPIALPVDAAIGYYESSALAWEQAAFIRSRAAAGDIALGKGFLDAIRPFIWRRSLDYGAIRNFANVSDQIRGVYSGGQAFGPGYDLKRGRGGIREVEFYAQMLQLIFGGRQVELRVPATRDALAALAASGHIAADLASELSAAYALFRTVEHRLQMVNDQQTHSLPGDSEALDRVARLHGLEDGAVLLEVIAPHVTAVSAAYDALIEPPQSISLPTDQNALETALAEQGNVEPEILARWIIRWRSGELPALRSSRARAAFETILPDLIAGLSKSADPQRALTQLEHIVSRLPTVLNFFELLAARPALLGTLSNILSHAPVLADALARRVELFDALIDATAFDLPPSVDQLAEEFGHGDSGDDFEQQLDDVRARVNERRFQLGVQLIEGRQDALEIAAGYARVAEAAVAVLARATINAFEREYGRVPGSEMLILALGRLGGGALTHASDLDVVFLFTGGHGGESDGPRALGATRYFNRLAQRIIAALSVPTAAGPLYEVDTRLRPSGAQGLLAVSVNSFEEYQRDKAWTWEHMALARARVIFGGSTARADLGARIERVLRIPRKAEELRTAVREMRLDIVANKPPHGPLDTKLMEGGLVDLEFIIHFLQLRTGSALHPELGAAIADLVRQNELPSEFGSAHDFMTRLLVALRLMAPDCEYPPLASRPQIAAAAGVQDWDILLAGYEQARQTVIAAWNRHLLPTSDSISGE
ncbi:MAG: bifunctional [glutamate--ammonia ligase]-adenylyl-L-tyrosine phosphorylase/[glutamate--ammonia-ligase] adenylyltransferase [Parasphingorhabdus sp.]|nr:bifunctional [glutamate--ammonia ligase]-adenylyl-L-tyrosine phosphorylase/[glutamate--ammonia-ligase] adenylyltransferase [Parasphingorhabdus sp.]